MGVAGALQHEAGRFIRSPAPAESTIRQSGNRFAEKVMRLTIGRAGSISILLGSATPMIAAVDQRGLAPARRPHRLALGIAAAAALCLVGAGLLLWSRHGAAVFNDTVMAAL